MLCAAHHVGDEPFAVLLGDDFIHPSDPLLQRMIDVRDRFGGSVVALMQVDSDQVSQYGCAAIEPTETEGAEATDLVEKPAPADAPSNWIVIGRYVCDPAVFEVLRNTPPGRGNEIQLTDALKTLAQMPATAAGYTGSSSAARRRRAPGTRSTTCAPSSSSRWSGGMWPPSSCRGCGSTWTTCRDRHGSGGGPPRAGARRYSPY